MLLHMHLFYLSLTYCRQTDGKIIFFLQIKISARPASFYIFKKKQAYTFILIGWYVLISITFISCINAGLE